MSIIKRNIRNISMATLNRLMDISPTLVQKYLTNLELRKEYIPNKKNEIKKKWEIIEKNNA